MDLTLDQHLQAWLLAQEAQQLRRSCRLVPEGFINFASNDYLGLSTHPQLRPELPVGSGASRLVSGTCAVHVELEEALAQWKGTAAALTFATGYAAALGALPALAQKGDTILLDKRAHACLIDGAKLSGATIRVYPHNDLNYLEKLLAKTTGKRWIVTESVFSMDGDFAPLTEIVALKEKYGAWLLVDEAHATGLYGSQGSGRIGEAGLTERVEVQLGTMSKALGVSGGYIAGSRTLIDYLMNRARSFIYSTAPSPAVTADCVAAVKLVSGEEGTRRRALLRKHILALNALTGLSSSSPIIPIIYGREENALAAAATLQERGFWVPAIRYPTVARGKARLRVTLTAAHSAAQIEALVAALPPHEAGRKGE